MFAIVKTGGKQYVVKKGSILRVEKMDSAVGDEVSISDVLLVDDGEKRLFQPGNLAVKAEVLEQCRGDKVIIFKKRRRKNYRRKNGHRQFLTTLKIVDIPALS